MVNWFEIFADKLTALEEGQKELRSLITHSTSAPDADPYGDFKWLSATCSGVPASTLRIKSASGEIPGVVKFGKRVLYDKAAVLRWLQSQTRKPAFSAVEIERVANEQVNHQLAKNRGVPA